MNISYFTKISVLSAVLAASSAHAAVNLISSKADFDKLGTIVSTTNFDAHHSDSIVTNWFESYKVDGGSYDAQNYWDFVTVVAWKDHRSLLNAPGERDLVGTFEDRSDEGIDINMFSFAGARLNGQGLATYVIHTQQGNAYSFTEWTPTVPYYEPSTPESLKFFGFQLTNGETLASVHSYGMVGITDIQLGMQSVSAVPEPTSFAMIGAGLAVIALARRRKKATV